MMNSMNCDSNQAPNTVRVSQICSRNANPQDESPENAKLEPNRVETARVSEVSINSADVLCGRGKLSFNHIGNRRFRDVISASVNRYNEAASRLEKAKIVNRIVEEIHDSGGRFLRQDEKAGTWHVLNHAQCREKVGHAVRDATSSIEARKKRKLLKEAAQKNVGAAIRAKPSEAPFPSLIGPNGLPFIPTGVTDTKNVPAVRQETFSSFATEEASRMLTMGGGQLPNYDILGSYQQQSQPLIQGANQTKGAFNSRTWTQSASHNNEYPKKTTKEAEVNDEQFLAYIDEVLGPAPM